MPDSPLLSLTSIPPWSDPKSMTSSSYVSTLTTVTNGELYDESARKGSAASQDSFGKLSDPGSGTDDYARRRVTIPSAAVVTPNAWAPRVMRMSSAPPLQTGGTGTDDGLGGRATIFDVKDAMANSCRLIQLQDGWLNSLTARMQKVEQELGITMSVSEKNSNRSMREEIAQALQQANEKSVDTVLADALATFNDLQRLQQIKLELFEAEMASVKHNFFGMVSGPVSHMTECIQQAEAERDNLRTELLGLHAKQEERISIVKEALAVHSRTPVGEGGTHKGDGGMLRPQIQRERSGRLSPQRAPPQQKSPQLIAGAPNNGPWTPQLSMRPRVILEEVERPTRAQPQPQPASQATLNHLRSQSQLVPQMWQALHEALHEVRRDPSPMSPDSPARKRSSASPSKRSSMAESLNGGMPLGMEAASMAFPQPYDARRS